MKGGEEEEEEKEERADGGACSGLVAWGWTLSSSSVFKLWTSKRSEIPTMEAAQRLPIGP